MVRPAVSDSLFAWACNNASAWDTNQVVRIPVFLLSGMVSLVR